MASMSTTKRPGRVSLEAQIAELQKENADMKIKLDQLSSNMEASEKQLNEFKSEKSVAEKGFNKLDEAEGKVNELQVCKAITERLFDVGLLPGIPNEITLDHICTKLPWSAFRSLSFVNHCWQEAVQSRWVYDARVRAQSTEPLVCVTRAPRYELWSDVESIEDMEEELENMGYEAVLTLYSLAQDTCYQLPRIPNLDTKSGYLGAGGLPASCQCVSLDGKIYVLGGTDNPNVRDYKRDGSVEVYVLDVAGRKPWKQIASMQKARMDFAACAMGGKIYVFGGRHRDNPVRSSELYDPEVDAWSPITPMTSMRIGHKAVGNGEEILVFGGQYYRNLDDEDDEEDDQQGNYPERNAWTDVEVYHPAKNEWRMTKNHPMNNGPVFMVNQKAYLMDWRAIHSFPDYRGSAGLSRRENSFPDMDPPTRHSLYPHAAVAVHDEIVAMVSLCPGLTDLSDEGTFLFQSVGFNSEDNQTGPDGVVRSLRWRKLNFLQMEGMFVSCALLLLHL